MDYASISLDEQKVIEIVWGHFERELKWPTRKSVRRLCADSGFEFNHEALRGVYLYSGVSSQEVRLSLKAALTLQRVRELLRPVPELLRLGAYRFIENPKFGNDPHPPNINHEDFARYWPDPTEMALARALFDFDTADWRLGGVRSSWPTGFSYSCSVEALRYEKVQTLEEALSVRDRRAGIPKGQKPSGAHLQLVEAVYRYATANGEWPIAIPFAVEYRSIGFIPELAEDLKPPYLDEGFGHWDSSRISLSIWSLPLVDATGDARAIFVNAVKALCQLWEESDDDRVRISLSELSGAMKEPESKVLMAALFIQSEHHLLRGGNFNCGPSEWAISIDRDVDISRYSKVKNWDDYLVVRKKYHGDARGLAWEETRVAAALGVPLSYGAKQIQESARSERAAEYTVQDSKLVRPRTTLPMRDSVFISYSRQDVKWVERLKKHLAPLVRSEAIKVWDDSCIQPGSDWRKEIKDALAHCKVAVLMVTADFLASEFIAHQELPPLLDAAKNEGLRILWVPVADCLVEKSAVSRYQSVLDPLKPLEKMRSAQVNTGLVKICKEIEKAMK